MGELSHKRFTQTSEFWAKALGYKEGFKCNIDCKNVGARAFEWAADATRYAKLPNSPHPNPNPWELMEKLVEIDGGIIGIQKLMVEREYDPNKQHRKRGTFWFNTPKALYLLARCCGMEDK